ncbi:acyl-CoA dehydrogenase family protein [Marisediminicola senii]|uniref:acyl-CoA dehydrogenase family protein n=1 Tax=Marisediminicola senii TaxID=2711233 RepID=UPI0013EBE590|nr:acyl-CoA dehydrogenase family protein [Marisediminicola senii]
MPFLDDALLARIHDRAPGYDRENAFFAEDLDELRAAGYLTALVPESFGGAGLTLAQVVREQARLAAAAPATALAIGMHLIWTGVAKALLDRGDDSLAFVLREAAEGELFAFAISEPANDLMLFGSTTDAAPLPDGSYAFTGTKIFTSLSPAWTRLGTLGLDATSVDAPKLVHAVIARETPGAASTRISSLGDWNTLGMRATQSHTTRLDGAVADAARVYRRLDPGPSADPLIFGIFANFEILVAAVYAGIGDRALALGVDAAASRTSARTGLSRDQDPDVRHRLADAALAMDALWPQIDTLARDVDERVDHGTHWFRRLVGVKVNATRTARLVVDQAIAVAGGASFSREHELSRLYRDVLAGGFHPSNDDSARATIATDLLGPLLPPRVDSHD